MARLLLNPKAGRLLRGGVARRLAGLGEIEIDVTAGAEVLADKVRRAALQGLDRILVGGGDGTLHHAIRGLAGTSCALGIVPLGSGNDLARALGVPLDPVEAVGRALGAVPRRVDLGSVDGRSFAGIAGIGFDGEVARFVNARMRRIRGRWIYPWAVARTLISFCPPTLSIEHDDGSYRGEAMLAATANSPYFGGGMKLAPSARLDDGRLDLVVVDRMPMLRFLAVFPRIYRGTHASHPGVHTTSIHSAKICADRSLTFYADGEPMAACAAGGSQVTVLPRALWVAA